tara:strand:+ start:4866 stop:5894 length:1029 start_codon:yes stop_codon:yes gene_type:complete
MSKKNSNVILKNGFKNFKNLSKVYSHFKSKLIKEKKRTFLIAVSGGPDSLALTALSKALNYEKKIKFHYVLVDHQIRKDSSIEAQKVKKMLKAYNISVKVLKNNLKIETNIQSQARQIRYRILSKYCRKKNIKKILTAHNLEDQVETFFIRLSRGSGLTGLSSMSSTTNLSENIKLIRPLLDIKKKILVQITKKIFGTYFKDPSNKDKKYQRTKIRNLEKPLLQSGINYEQIYKSINHLASSKATLDGFLFRIYKSNIRKKNSVILINYQNFSSYNDDIKIRILNESIKKLKKNYYNPRSKKVVSLIRRIKGKDFKKTTLAGCLFYIKNGQLCIKREKSDII